ncbi:MAG TPA: hypothetical protein PKC87_01735 [Candidatus Absconditabacterales bacterium]|nr:hypothetical protein [Candidatus Absconditabacterales bacterium]
MRIEKDKNNLLTIFNENIPQTKEYTYHVGGYIFSDFDKGIIVLHKKERKIISLKNLGDTMSVVYIKNTGFSIQNTQVEGDKLNGALRLFQGFNEETGKKYYFIPGLGEAQQEEKNNLLKKIGTKYSIEKTGKGMIVEGIEEENKRESVENTLIYLFGLLLIYGKWEEKNTLDHQKNKGNEGFLDERGTPANGETGSMNEVKGGQISKVAMGKELSSIKIQIPLAGQYLAHTETLDMIIKKLQENGLFLKADKLVNKNGIIYQISSNDYELLEIWAKWYEPVEKFEKITKREFTQEMKIKLIEFITTNPEIPQEGKSEILEQLNTGMIKLLIK